MRSCREADGCFLLESVDVGLFGLTSERQRGLASTLFRAHHKVTSSSGWFSRVIAQTAALGKQPQSKMLHLDIFTSFWYSDLILI